MWGLDVVLLLTGGGSGVGVGSLFVGRGAGALMAVGGGGGGRADTIDLTGTEDATTALTGCEGLIRLAGLSSSNAASLVDAAGLSPLTSCSASLTAVSTSSKKASKSSSIGDCMMCWELFCWGLG